ncbi:MAG: hypothetical protein M0Z60_13265 [Nitrospiraceae bacterium]|nr:hypothetical protein [Nitrospiraceae bacterium]
MRKARRILRNLNVINVILAGGFLLLLTYAVLPTFGRQAKITLSPPKSRPAAAGPAAEKPAEPKTVSPADYVVIADQNLFHPDRKIPVEKKEVAALPTPEFVLYGTLLTDDLKIAYMEDKKAPQNSPTRGKKQIPVKLGEPLSGFILKEIDKDKVVMVRGDEKVVVYLNEAARPKTRETAAAAPVAAQAPAGARMPQPLLATPAQPSPAVSQGAAQSRVQDNTDRAAARRAAIEQRRRTYQQDRGGLFRNGQ